MILTSDKKYELWKYFECDELLLDLFEQDFVLQWNQCYRFFFRTSMHVVKLLSSLKLQSSVVYGWRE